MDVFGKAEGSNSSAGGTESSGGGRRCVSVNDIRRAFEKAEQSLAISSLSSQGQVSSMMMTMGFPEMWATLLSMMTMSGFSAVTSMSGGIVPPPIVLSFRSE